MSAAPQHVLFVLWKRWNCCNCFVTPCALQIVFAKVCGWAHAFMVTIDTVQQGQELLYDYGHSYCKYCPHFQCMHVCMLGQVYMLIGS